MGPDSTEEPTLPIRPNSSDPIEIARRHHEDPPDPEYVPDRIGPYKILRKLGGGGMGLVYLAEQGTPSRRIAIKIIPPYRKSKEILARFDIEREALALMDHPNIAKVFDAGESADGRPYFVMEYVHGISITEYCDLNKLTTKERLGLFADVCRAVHHAHQKGIIHRDIKPGNVLVSIQDDHPTPKVIDFGVAKAVGHQLTQRTIFTEQGQLIGTPGYMSPEQAEMNALDIDIRTDIYSLGVLLYELLVGAQPFDTHKLLAAGFGEIQRVIREVDPPKPSTKFSSMGDDSTVVASNRKTVVRSLSKELRGDLDWITMKCLEKDRTHRYQSASALTDDIERHLRAEPVSVGPPSVIYKLRKFTRRHRFGVLATTGIAAALLVGFIGTAVQYVEKSRQFDRAERESATTREVSDFLVDLFQVVDPGEALGRTIPVREILDRGAVRIRSQLADRPLVRAAMHDTIGKVYSNLGLYKEAEELLREAVEIRRRELPVPHDDTVTSLHHLGDLLQRQGRFEDSEALHLEGLAMRESLHDRRHLRTADSLSHVALLSFQRNQREESLALRREVLEIRQSLLSPDDPRIAAACMDLGMSAMMDEDFPAAREYLRRAHEIYVRANMLGHPEMAECLLQRASLAYAAKEWDDSDRLHNEALELLKRLYGPKDVSVSRCLNGYATFLTAKNELERAEAMVREALSIDLPRRGATDRQVASHWNLLGSVLRKQKEFTESEKAHRESLRIRTELEGNLDPMTALSHLMLGLCLGDAGRYEEAEMEYLTAIQILETAKVPEGLLKDSYAKAARFYGQWGKEESQKYYLSLSNP